MNKRLLSPQQLSACYNIPENNGGLVAPTTDNRLRARQAIDTKIAEAQDAKTLKEVGEKLPILFAQLGTGSYHIINDKIYSATIEALRRGEMPE